MIAKNQQLGFLTAHWTRFKLHYYLHFWCSNTFQQKRDAHVGLFYYYTHYILQNNDFHAARFAVLNALRRHNGIVIYLSFFAIQ
jgi:hypothetical protein